MERAASALCVVPAQCTQVLRISFASCVMRSRWESTRLPVYGCLVVQQAKAALRVLGSVTAMGVWCGS